MGNEVKRMWGELRRRRVVSTAAAYAAVSFVLLQLGEILFPAFDLGAGAVRVLLAVLVALFPVVLALSWVYDITSSGIARSDDGHFGASRAVLVIGVFLSATALGYVGWRVVRSVDVGGPSRAAIAVLPFTDMSEDASQAYLGDGLAEEILNILAKVEGLQVAARTSSFAFRESQDIRDIGDRLNVSSLLEGSVRKDGESVRITAQLIDTQSGFHLWSETYDREVDDLFAVQDEIAQAIAEELLGRLDIVPASGTRHVVSAGAQEAYWKGREQWSRRDAVGLPEAIRFFNKAIELDSAYAHPYAGLADSWALLPQVSPNVSAAEALQRAEDYARKAIALEDDLPEARASLGLVLAFRRDRAGALAELDRAISVNASYAPALHWRANVLAESGRLPEALRDAQRAAEIDNLSAAIAADLGWILLWSGDIVGAEAEFERATRLTFGYRNAVLGKVMVSLAEGDPIGLRMSLTEWSAVARIPMAATGELAESMLDYAELDAAGAVPAAFLEAGGDGRLDAGTLALLHVLVGDREGTMSWLTASLADNSWTDQYVGVNSAYDPMRGDADFEAFLAEIGG